jgi:hypothetical protein
LQPRGVQASNDLKSLPQLHFCIIFSSTEGEYIYIVKAQIRSLIINSFFDFITYHYLSLNNSISN